MEARSNAMHHAFHLKKSQGVTKNCLFVDVQPNACVSESFGDIKKETGTAAEIENVTAPAAIKGKILRAFDVAFNPKLGEIGRRRVGKECRFRGVTDDSEK